MQQPVHVAIVRRIKPGCEAEFQAAVREFFRQSLTHSGILGASLLTPPNDDSREYGILRTFADRKERDLFYASPFFAEWEERVAPLTEGEPQRRELSGLEAWFRDTKNLPPPRWKMMLLTWLAVWPVSMAVPDLLKPIISGVVHPVIFAGLAALGIVLILTWVAMPVFVFLTKKWLYPPKK
ncbi:MAG: antibiotic biosynthesis monooxygenase [Verrucomicrobiales bacterium]|jgi:antibiotic biosynthesis monooxygenase (ABM) superfamily enzyme|nr:antibiotic biosynthesis monooxygenase [Verrucomicrobiales bacterium]